MKKFEVEGLVTALSPLFHGGDEKTGSSPVLRAINLYVEELGGEMIFPFVSGNAVRGKTRRLLMHDLVNRIGCTITNAKIHHILYTGGLLESTESGAGKIDLDFRRQVYEAIPPLALYGTMIGNQALEGNLVVEHMWPLCREYRSYLPEPLRANPRCEHSVREFTDQSFLTRRDDLHADRKEKEQAHQMKIEYECFIPGTQFYHRWALKLDNPLHVSMLAHVLDLFGNDPFIGGRSSAGDGKLRFEYTKPDGFSSAVYLAAIEELKERTLAVIEEVGRRL